MAGVDGADGGGAAQEQFVSLYRRFRPGRFGELRGQPHVVRALQGSVRDGRVAHAYLFSGPRGTGKTSTARILARALNCADPVEGEPCGVCTSCVEIARGTSLDVHELDAASNNGVDAMRDLISHAALATPGRWKVYIVDEVHMLSNAAANALLKTLEEPPGHVVFVLATTDPQKVPPTIKSRTQHFEFGLLGAETLTELVHDVNAAAGLALADDALSVAVRKGRGSARDTLSALDQVAAGGGADATRTEIAEVTEAFCDEDARRALLAVASLAEVGWSPQQLAMELVDELRQAFLAALAPELATAQGPELERLGGQAARLGLPRLVRAMETLGRAQVDMRDAPDARSVLEVALVRLTRPELDDTSGALLDRVAKLEQAVAAAGAPRPAPPALDPVDVAPTAGPAAPPATPAPAASGEDTAGRPGLGALRRQRAATSAAPPTPASPGAMAHAGPAPAPPGPGPAPDPAPAPAQTAPARAPARALEPRPAPAPPPAAAPAGSPGASGAVDRDTVVQAWGDHVLRSLPARPKALYSAGRFVAVEGAVATFALPNAAHRDRCEDVRRPVEEALSSYFATPVSLRLVVDDAAPGGPAERPGSGRPGPAGGSEFGLDPDDEVMAEVPGDARSVEQVAHARLLETFPGAEEVTG